jgi:pimeloyl-ACP methyl ester carboxylesterase
VSLERVRSADGTTIAFDRLGSGPPLVLLAGGMCDRRTFTDLADALATDFEVLNVDRRGRGDSGDTPPYAVAREVEDIAAVVRAAGGPVALFGHSSGAALALEAVAGDSDGSLGVDRLLLFEPPYMLDPVTNRQSADLAERYAGLVEAGRRGDAVELFMTTVGMPPEAIAGARSQPFWPALEGIAHTLAYDAAIMGDGTFPAERAAAVRVPTLVIVGGASPAWAAASGVALEAVIPDATLRTIEGQDHNVTPGTLGPVISEWLTGALTRDHSVT